VSSRQRLTRSTSDKSPRCPAKHHRSTDHDSPETAAGVTQWPAAGDRATLPRAGRDARTAGDVWRPMNDVEDPSKELTSQHYQSTAFERPVHRDVATERSGQPKTLIKSPTFDDDNCPDDQCAVWTGSTSSPWETCTSTTQCASRQTSVHTLAGPSGVRLNNYAKFDYCNSLTQPPKTPGMLSRSWFDIETPQSHPTLSMPSCAVGPGNLHHTPSIDVDKSRGVPMAETKTVCNICSSEAFVTENQVKTDVGRSCDQSQVGVLRERGYRGTAGGSLPRCYGQRTGDLGVPGSTSSMPRGISMFSGGSAVMSAVSQVVSVSSSVPPLSSDHSAVVQSTAAAGNDVRMITCPSPKRSLSSRDDECENLIHSHVKQM